MDFSNEWGRDVQRLARRRNMSEQKLLEHALELVKEEKNDETMLTLGKENTIYLKSLRRRVPESMAHAIWREIGGYFGKKGQGKLTPAERTAKARHAAQTRWKRKKKLEG